ALLFQLSRPLRRRPRIILTQYYDTVVGPGEREVHVCLDLEPQRFSPATPRKRKPRHFLIIIDRSTSMKRENRLYCAKEAACEAVRHIRPGDSFSVIAFSHEADVVYRGGRLEDGCNEALITARQVAAMQAIRQLEPRYGTDFGSALHQAFREFVMS